MDIFNELDNLIDDAEDAQRKAYASKQKLKSRVREALNYGRDRHLPAYDKLGESNIVPILFMDIVGYSKLTPEYRQKDAIELLNELVAKALPEAKCTLDDVVCLPTGDGMCLCFLKSTDGPLTVAARVQRELSKQPIAPGNPKIEVRMGVHFGNVLRVTDLKGSYNLAGAAINISQRAMNFGDEGHILCTAEAYEKLKGMKDYEKAIRRVNGYYIAKHGVKLRLFKYYRLEEGFGNPSDPKR
jgi:class 3 adenylate cyclase